MCGLRWYTNPLVLFLYLEGPKSSFMTVWEVLKAGWLSVAEEARHWNHEVLVVCVV